MLVVKEPFSYTLAGAHKCAPDFSHSYIWPNPDMIMSSDQAVRYIMVRDIH